MIGFNGSIRKRWEEEAYRLGTACIGSVESIQFIQAMLVLNRGQYSCEEMSHLLPMTRLLMIFGYLSFIDFWLTRSTKLQMLM